ncbi:unnamed protein product [marine sediment metagenome]|uniref:HTH luxR-type domain-containing protein n=1 Tax=marine sediment metagenome TaxID=412755 RepID=X1LVQ5_9ZZZZ
MDKQLIELYAQGFYDGEIAEKLGVHPDTVGYHRRRLELKAHGRRRLFTDEQLIELHEQGLNDEEITEKLGAHSSTVKVHRKRLELKAIRKHIVVMQQPLTY